MYDKAGKISDKYKMYFSVVPDGFGDVEPEVQYDLSQNGSLVDTETITISGNVLTGAEQGDVYIEVALDETVFDASAVAKYGLGLENKWAKSDGLGDGDAFELTLDISDLYDNLSKTQRVYFKIYEGDDKRWEDIKWIEVTLPMCQGEIVPVQVLAAEPDAYWIWDESSKECVWSGDWSWEVDENGVVEVNEPASEQDSAESGGSNNLIIYGGIAAPILVVILSLFFVLRGGNDDTVIVVGDGSADFNAAATGYAGVAQMDPMEQYVQQLIAQGYPEETARAYAQQYATHFQQQ